jgi:hypothetical protein
MMSCFRSASFTRFAPPANPSEGAALATSVAKVLACLASVLLYLNGDLDDGLPQVSELAIAIQEELGAENSQPRVLYSNVSPHIRKYQSPGHHWQT